jgi:hypothetical protein
MFTFKPIQINSSDKNISKNVDTIPTYNFKTSETYRMKRLAKRDVFNDEKILEEECFKYYKIWNPYTGKILDKNDEFGPLCFNGYELSYFYYSNRLNGMWNAPVDGFDGFYGDILGTGKNINIISRGHHPQRYLLRLPIIDCYLNEESNYSRITMGPLLSDEEIQFLDNILNYNKITFNKSISNTPNLLKQIKYNYDEALNPNPDTTNEIMIDLMEQFPLSEKQTIIEKYNRYHVDVLKLL